MASKLTSRRSLISKPVINQKVLTKIKQKDRSTKNTTDLSEKSDLLGPAVDPTQDDQPTSCFDIIQADIVIPGLIVKDDNNEMLDQQHILIPAFGDASLGVEHSPVASERAKTNLVVEYLSIEEASNETDKNTNDSNSIQTVESLKLATNTKHFIRPKLKSETDETRNSETDSELIAKENIINESISSRGNHVRLTDSKTMPIRRIFAKPALNKKLLAKRKPETIVDVVSSSESVPVDLCIASLPEEVTFDSQSDALQLNELEIVSFEQDIVSEDEKSHPFVKPLINVKPTKSKKEESIGFEETEFNAEQLMSPLSTPIKTIARSRIKAVPRLGQRRSSVSFHGSASESEDELYKKYRRIRTESASSTTGMQDVNVNNDPESIEKGKDVKLVSTRKCRRSDQSRKIAEARRNFIQKFGKGVPDKQRLTMMDLIFYNPCTEPMSQKPEKQKDSAPKEESNSVQLAEATDNNADKSTDNNKENETTADKEDDLPAPQIKIGLNGEIIIDEQSLVIENAETRKSREEIQKSSIIDGDFDTGYGIYKRVQRTKDWTKAETMHFYKALNTLGTDFMLMSEFFHNRSRRELKMKFKKEERLNLALVDKALSQPPQFDMNELRQDFEKQKEESKVDLETEVILRKKNEYLKRMQCPKKKEKTRKKKAVDLYSRLEKGASSLWDSTSDDEPPLRASVALAKKKALTTSKSNIKKHHKDDSNIVRNTKLLQNKVKSSNGKQVEDTGMQLSNILKPTRSGRVPKRIRKFDAYDAFVKKACNDNNNLQQYNEMQPGSLMIISCPTPTGHSSVQVFMITGKQDAVPVTLSPDVLQSLTVSEDNVTTPANKISLIEESSEVNESLANHKGNTVEQEKQNIEDYKVD